MRSVSVGSGLSFPRFGPKRCPCPESSTTPEAREEVPFSFYVLFIYTCSNNPKRDYVVTTCSI